MGIKQEVTMNIKRYLTLMLVILCISFLFGCSSEEVKEYTTISSDVVNDNSIEDNVNTGNQAEKSGIVTKENGSESVSDTSELREELIIYGKWSLDEIALISDMLMFPPQNEEDSSDLFDDSEMYLGLDLEVNESYLRLGDKEFLTPIFSLEYMTVKEFNDGGDFKLPDVYTFLLDENIIIDGIDEYESLSDIPLKVYKISFDEDYTIPIKSQFLVLNHDTMLIGVWGKIILAKRI